MSYDPHGRFVAWLLEGGRGDPPRDVALHASVCPTCATWIAAQDALTNIDVGRASLPPPKPGARPSSGRRRVGSRQLAASASLILVAAIVGYTAAQLLSGRTPHRGQPEGSVLAASGPPASVSSPGGSRPQLASPTAPNPSPSAKPSLRQAPAATTEPAIPS